MQNFNSLLTSFSIFLQTKKSNNARVKDLYQSQPLWATFAELRERYYGAHLDSKRVAKIRERMASAIIERNLQANVQTNDDPGCTIKDLRVLAEYLVLHADVATGVKPVHDAALLIMMWHIFERAIYTCFARKQQLAVAAQLLSVNLPAPATASTLAECVLNWYTNQIWETVKSKEEQNKTANAKAAVNIMLVLYQSPCTINQPLSTSNASGYQAWKHTL
ncbi:LOW QUALITY PROTEIN: Hypothetical protein PHPALM_20659 [Phytophthora palmivora]|uniref:Uncharacterized protein n=1 Tax=Phytophthora palmivora TaxID=4796 RepID=A0A2P4XEB4_9STRA|nr:LOW QUALITY PROTEIN: Hypothetical protein PHPALM_20659 [Phytophthora palmivora]